MVILSTFYTLGLPPIYSTPFFTDISTSHDAPDYVRCIAAITVFCVAVTLFILPPSGAVFYRHTPQYVIFYQLITCKLSR